MRKKEFWDYSGVKKQKKAPEASLGSRLLRILFTAGLTVGCFTAAAVAAASLSFYFYPARTMQAANTARDAIQSAAAYVEDLLTPDMRPRTAVVSQNTGVFPSAGLTSDSITSHKLISNSISDGASGGTGETTAGDSGDRWADEKRQGALVLDTAMGPMLYYSQSDSRWADYLYGGHDALKDYGCGPTVVAMLVNAFTDEPVTPDQMADWCSENGCYARGNGSYHSIIADALSAHGLTVESAPDRTYETAAELLRSGHVLVGLMGKGTFANAGHFLIITDILENGNVTVADSDSLERTATEWDLEQILKELKHANDGGGPLWVVGKTLE